jgi:hypothetical protein
MKTTKIVVALYLSQLKDTEILGKARTVAARISESKSYPEADFKSRLTDVTAAADELDQALQSSNNDNKADRVQGARIGLELALTALGNEVAALANKGGLDLEDRLALVHGAGLDVRNQGSRSKRFFSVERGDLTGTVNCFAETAGSVAHEWQYTADVTNLGNRVTVPTTTKSMTQISGLKSGQEHAFFHKPVKAGVETAWEGPIFIMVV